VIGNGVVFDPVKFLEEIEGLQEKGIDCSKNLVISDRAQVVMPYHKLLDGLYEAKKKNPVGTTGRGIGPTYADKVSYQGIRVGHLKDKAIFISRLAEIYPIKKAIVEGLGGTMPSEEEIIKDFYEPFADKLRPYIKDTFPLIKKAISEDKNILCEGAQGALLDVDFGTYPYVSGSNTSALGVPAGAGVPPQKVGRVVGTLKAYTTRVGMGGFPTELLNGTGEQLRKQGAEFGTTTGRARRCGWLDLGLVGYAAFLSGVTEVIMTKLDVLSGLETLKIATGYKLDGKVIEGFPGLAEDVAKLEPIYKTMPGWQEDITQVKTFAGLPKAAQNYVRKVEGLMEVKISNVCVGPERTQILKA
jgi:adenylosuccinate synthase